MNYTMSIRGAPEGKKEKLDGELRTLVEQGHLKESWYKWLTDTVLQVFIEVTTNPEKMASSIQVRRTLTADPWYGELRDIKLARKGPDGTILYETPEEMGARSAGHARFAKSREDYRQYQNRLKVEAARFPGKANNPKKIKAALEEPKMPAELAEALIGWEEPGATLEQPYGYPLAPPEETEVDIELPGEAEATPFVSKRRDGRVAFTPKHPERTKHKEGPLFTYQPPQVIDTRVADAATVQNLLEKKRQTKEDRKKGKSLPTSAQKSTIARGNKGMAHSQKPHKSVQEVRTFRLAGSQPRSGEEVPVTEAPAAEPPKVEQPLTRVLPPTTDDAASVSVDNTAAGDLEVVLDFGGSETSGEAFSTPTVVASTEPLAPAVVPAAEAPLVVVSTKDLPPEPPTLFDSMRLRIRRFVRGRATPWRFTLGDTERGKISVSVVRSGARWAAVVRVNLEQFVLGDKLSFLDAGMRIEFYLGMHAPLETPTTPERVPAPPAPTQVSRARALVESPAALQRYEERLARHLRRTGKAPVEVVAPVEDSKKPTRRKKGADKPAESAGA